MIDEDEVRYGDLFQSTAPMANHRAVMFLKWEQTQGLGGRRWTGLWCDNPLAHVSEPGLRTSVRGGPIWKRVPE